MSLIRRREAEPTVTRARDWDPFEVMQDMLRWDPFRDWFRAWRGGEMTFAPAFEVKETKNAFVFKSDLPGVKESELDISLSGNRLTVSGQRQEEQREEGERYYTYERSYGSFSRSFTLPDGVDPDKVEAELKDGVLTITVPKKPEMQPKRIEIRGAPESTRKAA